MHDEKWSYFYLASSIKLIVIIIKGIALKKTNESFNRNQC